MGVERGVRAVEVEDDDVAVAVVAGDVAGPLDRPGGNGAQRSVRSMPMSMPAWRWLPRHSPKRAVTEPLAGHVIWRRAVLSKRAEAAGATTREASRTTSALRKGSVRVMGRAQRSLDLAPVP